MFNRVTLIGNLGKDPEMRNTTSGATVANLSVATKETWRDKSTGERKEKTEWVKVVSFNEGLNKVIEQYLRKGSLVMIEGKLQTRKWTDQSGVERYSTEVVLQSFDAKMLMLGGKRDAGAGDNDFGTNEHGSAPSGHRRAVGRHNDDMDDDIPF